VEQPVRTGVDHPDPGSAGVHLRPLRQRHASEPRHRGLHVRAVPDRWCDCAVG
nr:hypothetical protein [Tanacetum cinerariifolium]